MVWGGFCGALKSDLVTVPGKTNIGSATNVVSIMEPYLVPFWQQFCEEYGWLKVVEDGAPGHKKYAIQYRDLNISDTLQSPDLNIIEALWVDMETELGETWGRVGDIEVLEAYLKAVWEPIPPKRLDSLIRSMPAKLQAVVDAEGGAAPY